MTSTNLSTALSSATLKKALDGGASLAEVLALVLSPATTAETEVKQIVVPATPPMTPEQEQALGAISSLFGQINPRTPRLLTNAELLSLLRERQTIDTLLSMLKTRKDLAIREFIANHLDRVAERDHVVGEETPRDSKGHYLVKVSDDVPGSDLSFVSNISTGKPTLTSADLLGAYERGGLTREEYLSVTTQVRVFDEAKARVAINKEPGLLFALAQVATPPKKTASITTTKN